MNTEIVYLYRDASNYKKWNDVIVAGGMSESDLDFIKKCLMVDNTFIPEQIGLPLLRPDANITEDDHCFAELCVEEIKRTCEPPTIDVSWRNIMDSFNNVWKTGWRIEEYAI